MTPEDPQPSTARLTRRAALLAAGGAAGAGVTAAAYQRTGGAAAPTGEAVPFYGPHQPGIATPQQRHLVFAAFDLTAWDRQSLQDLLRSWSAAAAALQHGRVAAGAPRTGEATGLGPASLTVTIGLGPGVFERDGDDALGLLSKRPAALAQIPPLPGDELQAGRSEGDMCIQACADDAQVSFHAVHALTLAARGVATPRWAQTGFLPSRAAGRFPRNLMGFHDGTNNLRPVDRRQMARHVWVGRDGEHGWMRNGTYVVTRRVRVLLDVWDGLPVEAQERAVGRRKVSGERLRGSAMPPDAHVHLATARNNSGIRFLRRGYSYNDGVDPDTGQIDAGLFFICFQGDPAGQFAAIQRRLGVHDALAKHLSHTSSAVFALPAGASRGGYVGEALFA